jgi:hypothetical protein
MTSKRIALLVSLCLMLASAVAEAGRPRGTHVLDTQLVLLPYLEQDTIYKVTLARNAAGQALLVDQSLATPIRVTPIGFTPPIGSNKGSFAVTPESSTWAAFASSQGIRVFELGDLQAPGPLAVVQRDAIPAGFDPQSAQLGIIAILIGLVAEPRPALFLDCFQGGCNKGGDEELVLGWNGQSFEPVELMEGEGIDGVYFFLGTRP